MRFGHPSKQVPGEFARVRESYASGEVTCAEAARELGVSVRTFSRWLATG